MEKNRYQCCFCGDEILSTGYGISSLLVTTNIDKDDEQQTQQFYCHLECFQEKICSSTPLYLLDLSED